MANTQPPQHEHVHTILKLPRTNAGAWTGAAVVGALVAAAGVVLHLIQTGALTIPPGAEPYMPWVVLVLTVVVAIGGALGSPSLHPGLTMEQPHSGPLVSPGTDPPKGG